MTKTINRKFQDEQAKHKFINQAYALACAYCCIAEVKINGNPNDVTVQLYGTKPNVNSIWKSLIKR